MLITFTFFSILLFLCFVKGFSIPCAYALMLNKTRGKMFLFFFQSYEQNYDTIEFLIATLKPLF